MFIETQTISETTDPTEWLDLYGDYLYRYAMFRLRNATAAEDIVQETLLSALQSRARYRGQSQEKTWLIGILKHKILDHFRKLGKSREISEADYQSDDDYYPFDTTGKWVGHWVTEQAPRDWQVDAAAGLEQKEFWEVFNRCVSELPEKTAIAFTLREIDGLSSEEICDVLNLSPNNLWVMLHRARLKLRSLLEIHWFQNTEMARNISTRTITPSIEASTLGRALKCISVRLSKIRALIATIDPSSKNPRKHPVECEDLSPLSDRASQVVVIDSRVALT